MNLDSLNWGDLTPEIFLAQYWQKKPLLIKQAFANFKDSISADELAGLAMEAEIQSRIVSTNSKGDWQVDHGPFEDFSQYGESNWTLLVQAVNNWSRPTHNLLAPFAFIPSWRIDDVMVSFSTPNGGVGAHLDQYDVFIIQGSGKRRWQVGAPDSSLESLLPHADLKQVSSFEAIIDEITEAGDLLYIPPNHPHKGLSIENSVNFSIGFQAPSSQELWSSFADKLIDNNLGEQRFSDPARALCQTSFTITPDDKKQLKAFMLQQLEQEEFYEQFMGQYLTQGHHALEILVPVNDIDKDKLLDILSETDISFMPVSGLKAAIINDVQLTLFLNGESFPLEKQTLALAQQLAQQKPLSTSKMKTLNTCLKNTQLLTNVLNKGYWYIE
ncbi:cupin domain-containing protein [Colwellia sp. MB3u-70]|uniref:cupin domain-containing protein n=1 Tax=unclassified Colwellia TaxID=196834 RepID=UPI0015F768B0|nr:MULTISPECIES: cupin domain-containing protein [unclassified Colwellia]MBA6292790.1 cupin domain-containing protein [Colwellia sp. MB3u-8]MBA6308126.1 cupin domain-containing protein [Colwellia sp. MB3u-70]